MNSKAFHICPHCNQALDQQGEEICKTRELQKSNAQKLLKEMQSQNWYLHNLNKVLTGIALFYLVLALHMHEIDLGFAMGSLLAIFPLLALVAWVKQLNEKKVFAKFKKEHPGQYDLLY